MPKRLLQRSSAGSTPRCGCPAASLWTVGVGPVAPAPVQNGDGGSDEHPDAAGGGRLSGAAGERCTGLERGLARAEGPREPNPGIVAPSLSGVVGDARNATASAPNPSTVPTRALKGRPPLPTAVSGLLPGSCTSSPPPPSGYGALAASRLWLSSPARFACLLPRGCRLVPGARSSASPGPVRGCAPHLLPRLVPLNPHQPAGR